jgi:hypothetical protein
VAAAVVATTATPSRAAQRSLHTYLGNLARQGNPFRTTTQTALFPFADSHGSNKYVVPASSSGRSPHRTAGDFTASIGVVWSDLQHLPLYSSTRARSARAGGAVQPRLAHRSPARVGRVAPAGRTPLTGARRGRGLHATHRCAAGLRAAHHSQVRGGVYCTKIAPLISGESGSAGESLQDHHANGLIPFCRFPREQQMCRAAFPLWGIPTSDCGGFHRLNWRCVERPAAPASFGRVADVPIHHQQPKRTS